MRVSVTEAHISRGVWGCGNNCPIALAIKEAAQDNVLYCESKFVLGCEGDSDPFGVIPEEVRERIRKADLGGGMEPFEFDMVTILENPDFVNREFDAEFYPEEL